MFAWLQCIVSDSVCCLPSYIVVKGKRGEEGPRGKQGSPVSELYSVISFSFLCTTKSIYV